MTSLQSDFRTTQLPRSLPNTPGTATESERRYLYEAARETSADSCAVELSSWLGRTTTTLCSGLASGTTLHVFDKFRWAVHHLNDKLPKKIYFRPGDDTRPLWTQLTQDYAEDCSVNLVSHRVKSLADLSWPGHEPIGLMLWGGEMSPVEIRRCISQLGPSLVPGSIFAVQQLMSGLSYPLALILGDLLGTYLTLAHVVTKGTTVGFEVIRPIGLLPADDFDIYRWPISYARDIWTTVLGLIESDERRNHLSAGWPLYLWDRAIDLKSRTKYIHPEIAELRGLAKATFEELPWQPSLEAQWWRVRQQRGWMQLKYKELIETRWPGG